MQQLECACVIHGDRYPWIYVDTLWAMLNRWLPQPPKLHVFTEPHRIVPSPMIRHDLVEWPLVSNTRKAWWYKLQMFDPIHQLEQIFYFDLDVVITGDLDWIVNLDKNFFWAIRDWRYLWRPSWQGINSSLLYWNRSQADHIWKQFAHRDISHWVRIYAGDQDFIGNAVENSQLRYFDSDLIRSWRWQIKDGGLDPKSRQHIRPGVGSIIPSHTKIMIFHGQPKPHEIQDLSIQKLWQI